MLKYINFIYFLILLPILNKHAIKTKLIIFPFQYSNNKKIVPFEPNSIITYYDKNTFYLSLEIGTLPSNLTLILDDSESSFILKDDFCLFEIENVYSISKSSSFKFDEGLNYKYIKYELKTVLNNTRDKIYLNQIKEKNNKFQLTNQSHKTETDNFYFLYIPNKEELKQIHNNKNIINESINFSPKCGYIGLLPKELNSEPFNEKFNFFYQLKSKNIIDNYFWFINYNKEDHKGELIIGATPHDIYQDKFSEDELYMIHSTLVDDKFLWQIHFSSIEILDANSNIKIFLGNNNGIISISNNFIQCPKDYFDNITSIFFQNYLDKNICKKENINKYNTRYTVIYCFTKNFTEVELKSFPVLSLNCNELNFVFEFNYNDLFLKADSVYIFKIIYNMDIIFWKLGNIFLEKYQFLFNYETKMFGVYHSKKINDNIADIEEKLMKDINGNNYIKILIIIGIIVLMIFLGVFILRNAIFFKRINSTIIEDYTELTEK